MSAKQFMRHCLRVLGIEIGRYPYRGEFEAWRKVRMFQNLNVTTVLDVGANDGGFAREVRDHGYQSKIVSFEPLSHAFAKLQKGAEKDPQWDVVNVALGAKSGEQLINISKNSASSSFLNMLASHTDAAPQSTYISTEKVKIATLDSLFSQHVKPDSVCYLKVDTQGFEKQVLEGSLGSLKRIALIQLETSLERLYEGAASFDEMLSFVSSLGYRPYAFSPGFTDKKTGRQLQVDITWIQKTL